MSLSADITICRDKTLIEKVIRAGLLAIKIKIQMILLLCMLFEILKKNPKLIKSLILPVDYLVVVNGGDIQAILNEQDEEVFLLRKATRLIWEGKQPILDFL